MTNRNIFLPERFGFWSQRSVRSDLFDLQPIIHGHCLTVTMSLLMAGKHKYTNL